MTDTEIMRILLEEAACAAEAGEMPIAAAVVKAGGIVSIASNRREELGDPTAHAEVLAIREAAAKLGGWRLNGCALYVTLEPCAMCAGACMKCGLDEVVYGAPDLKNGAFGGCADFTKLGFTEKFTVRGGICAEESLALIRGFFAERREGRSERRRYWHAVKAGRVAAKAPKDDEKRKGTPDVPQEENNGNS